MRKLLALPFGLIFIGLLLISLTALSLRTFAFEPSFYTDALKGRGVFQDFERDPLKYVDLSAQFSQLKTLPAETQRQIITAALPSGLAGANVEESAARLLRLAQVRRSAAARSGARSATDQGSLARAAGQSDCPGSGRCDSDLCGGPISRNCHLIGLPECWPDNLDRSLIVDQVAQVLDSSAAGLSASIDVGRQFVSSAAADRLASIRSWLQLALRDVNLFVLAAATLLVWLIGALIGGRNSKERFTWLGGWLMFGALVAVGVYALIFVGGSRAVLLSSAGTLPDGLTTVTISAVQNLAATALQQLVIARHHSGGGIAHRRGDIDRDWGGAKIEPFLKSLTNSVSSDTIDPRLPWRTYV